MQMSRIYYINVYSGQMSTVKNFRPWLYPPHLKGRWYEYKREIKMKHLYIYMGKEEK